jgi:catechol 2,3-dioxygenase-like lactoylglutathione lyase family enzyme
MEVNVTAESSPRGIDHVGVTVPDIEAAARFLEAAFDATTVYDVQTLSAPPMAGKQVEHELGIPRGAGILHMRLMRLGVGPSLELFQFGQVEQKPSASLNDFGLQHVAVYVDDIAAAAARFERAGGTLLSPPHGLAGIEDGPGNAGVYGRAPWGGLIELITYPAGVDLPKGSPTRWTPPPTQK